MSNSVIRLTNITIVSSPIQVVLQDTRRLLQSEVAGVRSTIMR